MIFRPFLVIILSMRLAAVLMILCLLAAPILAETAQAHKLNYWQEFDITFWQTLPFAAFWGYAINTQLAGGGAVNWNAILAAAAAVSAVNANLHARGNVEGRR